MNELYLVYLLKEDKTTPTLLGEYTRDQLWDWGLKFEGNHFDDLLKAFKEEGYSVAQVLD